MARTRNLKPGFFKNEDLCDLHPLARLLFAGLWTIADREGRLEDRPKRIKADVLPYDRCDIDSLLQSLYQSGFITRYESGGNRYISIPTWGKHQNPHVKECASTIPAPDEHGASTVQEPEIPERAGPSPILLKPTTATPSPREPPPQKTCAATSEYPLTASALTEADPTIDGMFAGQIIAACVQAYVGVDDARFDLTDELLAQAVGVAAERKANGRKPGAGLLLKTVPNVITNWARQGILMPRREENPNEVHYDQF